MKCMILGIKLILESQEIYGLLSNFWNSKDAGMGLRVSVFLNEIYATQPNPTQSSPGQLMVT